MNFLYNKYKLKDSINSLYMTQGYYERNNSSPQVLNHNPTHNKITKSAINYSNILQLNDLIVIFNNTNILINKSKMKGLFSSVILMLSLPFHFFLTF